MTAQTSESDLDRNLSEFANTVKKSSLDELQKIKKILVEVLVSNDFTTIYNILVAVIEFVDSCILEKEKYSRDYS